MLRENIQVGVPVRINNGDESGRCGWNMTEMPRYIGRVGIVSMILGI